MRVRDKVAECLPDLSRAERLAATIRPAHENRAARSRARRALSAANSAAASSSAVMLAMALAARPKLLIAGRADHRAGCDHAASSAQSYRRPCRRLQHGRAAHHAQPRARGWPHGARLRHVCRTSRRERRSPRRAGPPRASTADLLAARADARRAAQHPGIPVRTVPSRRLRRCLRPRRSPLPRTNLPSPHRRTHAPLLAAYGRPARSPLPPSLTGDRRVAPASQTP